MSRPYSPKLFSYLFSYSDEDIANQLSIKPQTVISWRQNGLKPIDHHRPTLYHGYNIKETLKKMNSKRKIKLDIHQFYCLGCKDVKTPKNGKITVLTQGSQVRVIGICPDCQKRIFKSTNWDQFHQIRKIYHLVEVSQLYDSETSLLNKGPNKDEKEDKTCLL